MSENPEKHEEQEFWPVIETALTNFATGYKPREVHKDAPTPVKELLAVKRQYAQTALKHKRVLTTPRVKGRKTAEEWANHSDETLRPMRRIGQFRMHDDEWKRVLVGKNSDLTFLLDGIVTKLRTIESYCAEPDTALTPFVGYFRLRLESCGRQFLQALQAAYNGPCWGVFSNVRKSAGTILKEAQVIVDTGGAELPDSVKAWFAEVQRQAETAETEKIAA